MIPFPPVVEIDIPGAFITKHPREQHDENSLSIPFMTGITADEGAMKSARKNKQVSICTRIYTHSLNKTNNICLLCSSVQFTWFI